MKKIKTGKKKNINIKKPANVVIIFTVIYVLMVVISVLERVSILKNLSTTEVSFMAVTKEFWFSFVVIALLIATIFAYLKKEVYGVALEFTISLSMIANILISVIVVGFDVWALIGTLIIPLIIFSHSIFVYIGIKKQKSA